MQLNSNLGSITLVGFLEPTKAANCSVAILLWGAGLTHNNFNIRILLIIYARAITIVMGDTVIILLAVIFKSIRY